MVARGWATHCLCAFLLASLTLASATRIFESPATYGARYLQVPTALATDDFNGEHKLDLVVVNLVGNSVSILLGDGKGGFRHGHDYAVGASPTTVLVADFNHDDKPDFA